MIARLGAALNRLARRLVPDPFSLALVLNLLVLLAGWCLLVIRGGAEGATSTQVVLRGWWQGFSNPAGLAFALQMCLVLVTGHALALSPAVQRLVDRLAGLRLGPGAAAALVALVSCLAAVVHWGLGAVAGALLAREMGRRAAASGSALPYSVMGAAAYCGLAVWHGGLSGSAPLKVAEAGHFLQGVCGVVPVSATLGSTLNLVVTGSLVLGLPLLFWALAAGTTPGSGDYPVPEQDDGTPGASTEEGRSWMGRVAGLAGLVILPLGARQGWLAFDLNSVNLAFLSLGLLLHRSLGAYLKAAAEGSRGAGAIILQFPLYFAILGVMKASGLVVAVAGALAGAATAGTFPVLSFLSAGLVNLFVPSGGGQWAVQGEVLLQAGQALGVAPAKTIMAFAYGDAWTNMLQPFWALPLLAITGLRARDIIGYTALVFLLMGLLVPLLLLVL